MAIKLAPIFSRIIVVFILFTVLICGPSPASAAPGDVSRVSVDSSGTQANGGSLGPAISADGRFVTFWSDANNLVSGDTNANSDVFIRDRQTGQTTRISVDASGGESNGGSSWPAISNDGRYVAYYSDASNLVSGDTNGIGDVFVYDRQTGQVTRASVSSSGEEANGEIDDRTVDISGDGRFVAFTSDAGNLVPGDTNGVSDVFVHDLQTGQTARVSVDSSGVQANGDSSTPALSNDGHFVTFSSNATNLAGNDNNGKTDVFVHDSQTGATSLVSVNTSGELADAGSYSSDISGDGRYVVFLSNANNLAPLTDESKKPLVYVRDRQVGQTILASRYSDGYVMITGILDQPTISNNGRYVAFAFYDKGENQGIMNIWVRDLLRGISVETIYGNASSSWPALSGDGSIVAFSSGASNIVGGDTNGADDVFVREVAYGSDNAPSVASITPECGHYFYGCKYPTPASGNFIVIFTEQVTGVNADDFNLTMSGDISGASITGVNGYGSEYFVTVNTGSGDGRLDLDLVDNDSILDSSNNPLGGVGTGNGDFTKGNLYWVDKSLPAVSSILRADANPTNADSVRFTVTFSESVSGVDASDFTLASAGSITGAAVTAVSGNNTIYTVTTNTGTGDGTLRLDVVDDDSIRDQIDNPLGGDGVGNGNFTTGETYTITKSAPSAPSVTSSLRLDPNPTGADLVSFIVTFSEPVTGVDLTDFSATTSGSLIGAQVVNMSGSGNLYTVLAATGSGDGSLRLDVQDDDSIVNASGIPLGGTGAGNGTFTAGEAYTVDKTAPVVTTSLRADPNPTTAASVNFTVVFSEPVTGVDVGDFSLTTTGSLSGAAVSAVNGSGYQYTVSVGTGSGDGTLRLDLLDNDSIVDSVGHPLGGPGTGNGNFTSGEEYTFNRTPIEKITETFRSNGANDGWVLESSENSNQGGFKDAHSTTIVVGDDAQNRQFRSILHFPTNYLPGNAVITRVLLMLKGEGVAGSDPFATHGNIVVDIRSGAFGFIGPFPYRGLQVSDFQSPSHKDAVGVIQNNPLNGWYWIWLDPSAFEFINRNGSTQIRLRFEIDDDNNLQNDFIRFYSGDYNELADRPRLVVEYYIPR